VKTILIAAAVFFVAGSALAGAYPPPKPDWVRLTAPLTCEELKALSPTSASRECE
jgi:hypothetical protein